MKLKIKTIRKSRIAKLILKKWKKVQVVLSTGRIATFQKKYCGEKSQLSIKEGIHYTRSINYSISWSVEGDFEKSDLLEAREVEGLMQ